MADDKAIAEIQALEEKFTQLLNEAMEQMKNPDGSISSLALIAIQSVYIKSAGFTEACCSCNGQVMTGQTRPRISPQMIFELYNVGFEAGERDFAKHGDDVQDLIKQRLIAMQTKVV